MTTILIGWYIFSALLITVVMYGIHGLTHSKFRDDAGDTTTEVGYEEDPEGHDLHATEPELSAQSQQDPHIAVTINQQSGPM